METVAMYWEPQIKTYGFQVTYNLVLYRYIVSPDLSAQWDRAMQRAAGDTERFHLLTAQPGTDDELDLILLCENEDKPASLDPLSTQMPATADRRLQTVSPVALLCFQGPHYGDRYGVADFTYRALGKTARHLHVAVFAGASVYLIFPEDRIGAAKHRLAAAFRIPG
jgi:hypothetical protein